MKPIKAIKFYNLIKGDKKIYRLVNGLFIVRYINEEESVYVGNFEKAGSVFNNTKTNQVLLCPTKQKFWKKRNLTTNGHNNGWVELRIKFIEKPIGEILK